MSRWRKPLTSKEVKAILKKLGFEYRNTEGGHENWVPKDRDAPFRKVTVDTHLAPFSHYLIDSMARQAGVSVREFYDALN